MNEFIISTDLILWLLIGFNILIGIVNAINLRGISKLRAKWMRRIEEAKRNLDNSARN